MSRISRKDYLNVARAVRDSGAAYESKRKVVDALSEMYSSNDGSFNLHREVFEALALSPERAG